MKAQSEQLQKNTKDGLDESTLQEKWKLGHTDKQNLPKIDSETKISASLINNIDLNIIWFKFQ